MKRVVLVRFKSSFKPQYVEITGDHHQAIPRFQQGTPCVVQSERGEEITSLVRPSRPAADAEFPKPLPKFVRLATDEDKAKELSNKAKEKEAFEACKKKAKEKSLDIKVTSVECAFDGTRAFVYFTAETRTDTREVSREIADTLGLKIEWKQVGARDQAAVIGGMGPCGRELCCTTFLKDYPAVSMRMAKEQNIPMNPFKLNGMCGRLKCCIAYEWGMKATGCEEHGSCERKYEAPEKPEANADAAQSRKS